MGLVGQHMHGSVPNLLLIELLAKQILWLEAHTNIVETLPVFNHLQNVASLRKVSYINSER